MKKFTGTIALVVVTVSCLQAQDRLPNIVFMFADDLGYGDLACYGHPYAKTPSLDKLAEEGTQFMRFYVTGNTCNPSRTGFMTSRHPNSYANNTIQHGFQDRISITEILREAGYRIGHYGKWHIGPDESVGTYGIHELDIMGGNRQLPEGRDTPLYKAAMEFMERNKDVPFYVNVWGHATHAVVDPAQSLADKSSDVVVDRELFGVHMQEKFDQVEDIGVDISVAMRNYLGDVYGLDSSVGLLLKKIDDLGLRENTIVVFSSDQGPAPVVLPGKEPNQLSANMLGWAGGFQGGKHNNWEGGVRAPFIIRWPGNVPEGKVDSTSLFSGMDWLPTLSAIAGADINEAMFEGENVSDIWKGSDRSRENPLFWKWAGFTVVQGYWKLTYQNGKAELFDLSTDAEELIDISADNPDVTEKMDELIEAWKASIPGSVNHDPGVFLDDPVKDAVVIGPADVPAGVRRKNSIISSVPGMTVFSDLLSKSVTVTFGWAPVVNAELNVFDTQGRNILRETVSEVSVSLDVSSWPAGVYRIQATADGWTARGNVFVQ